MTTDTATTSVTASIVVETAIDRAFELFTMKMDTWWNPDHHIIDAPLDHMVFEPCVGGSIYDVGTDGSTCHWARVLAYEPPELVVFSWDINMQWEPETDPARASEVEVRFLTEGPERTRVDLTHRHLDRHGPGWEQMRDAVGSGWKSGILVRLAAACAA